MSVDLEVDPHRGRPGCEFRNATGIYVRAKHDGKWGSHDITWLRSLRDQCAAAGVAFFLKQAAESELSVRPRAGSVRKPGGIIELPYLDGVQHAAFPECTR